MQQADVSYQSLARISHSAARGRPNDIGELLCSAVSLCPRETFAASEPRCDLLTVRIPGSYVRDVKTKPSKNVPPLQGILICSALGVDGRKHGRRLIWLLSAGRCRMTKVRRGASSV